MPELALRPLEEDVPEQVPNCQRRLVTVANKKTLTYFATTSGW